MRPLEWIWIGALMLVFAPALLSMSAVWSSVDYYSHGYLVPLVALWAAFGIRPRLARLPSGTEAAAGSDPRALAALAGALAIYALGLAADEVSVQGVALVAAVAALLAYLRGRAWLRELIFPVTYLLFMVPLPQVWLTPVIVRLQVFVSTAGVGLLQGFGVAVARDGNVILLPGGESLFVAEACSGITSVITLIPLAVFLAYFTEHTNVRRLILIAAVVPLAMLGNLVRVVGTVLAAQAWSVEGATTGPLHEWAGLFTYVLGCLALLGIGELMNWIRPRDNSYSKS